MATNTLWKVQDLEKGTEELWKSTGFLEKFNIKKKTFEERQRLNSLDSFPMVGIIFRKRFRISIVYVNGM